MEAAFKAQIKAILAEQHLSFDSQQDLIVYQTLNAVTVLFQGVRPWWETRFSAVLGHRKIPRGSKGWPPLEMEFGELKYSKLFSFVRQDDFGITK